MKEVEKYLIGGIITSPGYQALREHIENQIQYKIDLLIDVPQSDIAVVNHSLGELKGLRYMFSLIDRSEKSVMKQEEKK